MSGRNVLVGVTGGIAVYKACEVVRLLVKDGHNVRVIMTQSAKRFVTPLTFEVLSRNPVPEDMWSSRLTHTVEHCEAAVWCDLFAVLPATANIMGKLAAGIADDLLTTIALAVPAATPCLLAPAMNVRMWENDIVQRNLGALSREGGGRYDIVYPVEKELACGDVGVGGLAAPDTIHRAIQEGLTRTDNKGAQPGGKGTQPGGKGAPPGSKGTPPGGG